MIAGFAKGKRLTVPKNGVRPTASRVKEAMFSILGTQFSGLTVLDAFAGSGSLGIEALSRGADHCSFVESDRTASQHVKRNLKNTGLNDDANIISTDVLRFLSSYRRDPFDIILMDPPYDLSGDRLIEILDALVGGTAMGDSTRLVLEVSKRTTIGSFAGLAQMKERIYGDTKLVILQQDR